MRVWGSGFRVGVWGAGLRPHCFDSVDHKVVHVQATHLFWVLGLGVCDFGLVFGVWELGVGV